MGIRNGLFILRNVKKGSNEEMFTKAFQICEKIRFILRSMNFQIDLWTSAVQISMANNAFISLWITPYQTTGACDFFQTKNCLETTITSIIIYYRGEMWWMHIVILNYPDMKQKSFNGMVQANTKLKVYMLKATWFRIFNHIVSSLQSDRTLKIINHLRSSQQLKQRPVISS